MENLFVGVDTGGTFTDFVLLKEGKIRIHKVLSTPHNPAEAILQGLVDLGVAEHFSVLVHGSTVATNAVLEQKGARTGLITTAGFRDVLEIGRQTRPKLYDLKVQKVVPLVHRSRRVEVLERLNERGEVLIALDEGSLEAAIEHLKAAQVEAVAICFLFSFVNPLHERKVAEAVRAAGFYVSVSHEVLPEFREYERTSTVVLNAYVGPLIERYLAHLENALPENGLLRIMQSNGGSISSRTARSEAARTLLSGPAAGVVGAAFVAQASKYQQAITLDIGGTSTDVSLIDGEIAHVTDGQIGGYPTKLPMIDIHTVGAGGGSIAWFDLGGALRVGPRSAGANPGPAAYNLGGTEATVTDANIVLGRLLPEAFLGGTMALDVSQAQKAVAVVAEKLELSLEEAALGIVRIVNANMEAAIRVISVERGFDPRHFVLIAFGGAGPLHACDVAAALHIPTVLVPATPGVLSALGMLAADVIKNYVRTIMLPSEAAEESVDATFKELEAQGMADLAQEGFASAQITLERALDLRYVGQAYELIVPFEKGIIEVVSRFHRAHERRFGYCDPTEKVQVVNVRLTVRGATPKPILEPREQSLDAVMPEPESQRSVIYAGDQSTIACETPVYPREALPVGVHFAGPAIITQYDTTTLLPPGWRAYVDPIGNLIAEAIEGK